MKQFLKYTLASTLGVLFALFLGLFILIGIMASIMASGEEEVEVAQKSVLQIKLEHSLQDRSSNDPASIFNMGDLSLEPKPGMTEVVKSIEKATQDPAIEGLYLNIPTVMAGTAQLQEIREALMLFKESGKFIVAYADGYDQKGYYLSSAADELYVHPEGTILFKGLGVESMFFKGTLEKLDVELQVIRHGKFKAAVEPFILEKMSDANREQTSALIHSIWGDLLSGISQSRNISTLKLNQIADKLTVENPAKAVELGFVDATKYPDEIAQILKEKLGLNEDDELELIELDKYMNSTFYNAEEYSKERIAVIYATGEIKGGKGDDTFIGEKNIRQALIDARKDDKVKSIVLRVNSPGGSALVSDLIWREVILTKEEKPIVVSMGNVAASGGYYISCAANYIYADATTITGSIGVFGIIPYTGKMMTKKLGVTFDQVTTNDNANFITTNQPLNAYQRQMIQNSVERVYESFIGKVAEGRNMTKEDVDRIGQGRVWSGTQALEIGLVDELGSLDDAINKAAELAELTEYSIQSLPLQKDPIQQIIEDITGQSTSTMLKYYMGNDYKYVEVFEGLNNRAVIQTRLPFGWSVK
ncbi:MAG: signal peptide peptidase SppA [Bacteroidetes bacterium 4572_77]|nr:MAG: signal peptide peptidase SppA [Bacteroidetes bacterium 4572_77]